MAVAQRERPLPCSSGPFGWGAEVPPLQEPHDRRVVVEAVIHRTGRGVRRREQCGNPEPGLTEILLVLRARPVVAEHRWPHVVEEATALVVDDDERAPLP